MPTPQWPPEALPYCVKATTIVRAEAGVRCQVATATGFWYFRDNPKGLYLVTNRHVCIVEEEGYYPERLRAYLRREPTGIRHFPEGDAVEAEIPLYCADGRTPRWLEFSDDHANDPLARDIAAMPYQRQATEEPGVAACFRRTSIAPEELLLDPGDDVRIIGCPRGEYDALHRLAVVRNGTAATASYVPYEGRPCFLVDAQLHPGISGSPVVTNPGEIKETWKDDGSLALLRAGGVFLVGVLSADRRGAGLGIVWRASLIEELLAQTASGE